MTTEEKKVMSEMERKIAEARKKNSSLEAQIRMAGGKGARSPLLTLDVELQVIKDVLFKNGLISEESFVLEAEIKTSTLLARVLEAVKEMKKKMSKIIIPNMVPPKNLKVMKN